MRKVRGEGQSMLGCVEAEWTMVLTAAHSTVGCNMERLTTFSCHTTAHVPKQAPNSLTQ